MSTAIHIELNALFFLILVRIASQSAKNENQQTRRKLFRYTVYGIMANLELVGADELDTGIQAMDQRLARKKLT